MVNSSVYPADVGTAQVVHPVTGKGNRMAVGTGVLVGVFVGVGDDGAGVLVGTGVAVGTVGVTVGVGGNGVAVGGIGVPVAVGGTVVGVMVGSSEALAVTWM